MIDLGEERPSPSMNVAEDSKLAEHSSKERSEALGSPPWIQAIPPRGYTLFLQSLFGSV